MTANDAFDVWKQSRVGSSGFNPRTTFAAGFDAGFESAVEESIDQSGAFVFWFHGDRWRLIPEPSFPALFKFQLQRDEGGYWAEWSSARSLADAYRAIERAETWGAIVMEQCS